jgi:hypothetical protein
MNDLSRRRFLTHSSLGVAIAGALAVVPGLTTALKLQGPRMMAGAQSALSVIHHDRDLAARLYAAARGR